jgi:hypothetical protein
MNKENLGLIYGFIAIRIFILYLSTKISSNIMNQIYTERVLINGEQPPKLIYQTYLFIVIDIVFSLFLMAFVWGILNLSGNSNTTTLNQFVLHYVITLAMIFILLIIISNTMYTKKYFLYKDDGLRAIRALNDLMFQLGTFICVIPVFMVVNDDIIPKQINKVSTNTNIIV